MDQRTEEQLLVDLQAALDEPTTADEIAKHQIAYRMHSVISELDEFCKMAADPETVDLIQNERIAVGQIVTRAQLVASFLLTRQPPALKVVRNG